MEKNFYLGDNRNMGYLINNDCSESFFLSTALFLAGTFIRIRSRPSISESRGNAPSFITSTVMVIFQLYNYSMPFVEG